MSRRTASDLLNDYIDKHEGKTNTKYYTPKRVTEVFSPRPKDSIDGTSDKKMSRDLISWIDRSYKDNIENTCQPLFNQDGKTSSLDYQKDLASKFPERRNPLEIENYEDVNEPSNLPSPERSENELESDQETITTETLLRTYSAGQKDQKWVTDASEYPNWVDNMEQSDIHDMENARRFSSVSSLLKSSPPEVYYDESRAHDASGLTMDDTASIDTEVILQTSVYGETPVNMGGNLHYPIFKDKRVEKILNDSKTKKKKHNKSILGRSIHGMSSSVQYKQSPQSKDVSYTKKILEKHRLGDQSGRHGKNRQVIGKSVEEISQNSRAIQERLYGDTGHRRGHQPRPRSKQEDVDDYGKVTGTSNVTDLIRARMEQMKLGSSKAKVSKEIAEGTSRQRQFVRQPVLGKGVTNATVGPRNEQMQSQGVLEKDRHQLLIPKTTDYMEQTSPRTSGYYSDMYLASPSTITRDGSQEVMSKVTEKRSVASYKKPSLTTRRESDISKSSVSTDTLMRQPPSGTKVRQPHPGAKHERSKTWASTSFRNQIPAAMSTPKNRFYQDDMAEGPSSGASHKMSSLSNMRSVDAGIDRAKTGISASITSSRAAPQSRPHSSAAARSFIQSRSQFSKSPILSDNFSLAENSYEYKLPTERTLSSIKSGKVRNTGGRGQNSGGLSNRESMASRGSYVANDKGERFVPSRWKPAASRFSAAERRDNSDGDEAVADDVGFYDDEARLDDPRDDGDSDRDRLDNLGADESDATEEQLNSHNRTWPSLERYKQRIKLVHSDTRGRSRPVYPGSGWAQEKRSIPLRSPNATAANPTYTSPTRKVYRPRQTTPVSSARIAETKHKQRSGFPQHWKSDTELSDRIQSGTANHEHDSESTTADTDMLLVQPPMPIVDASPSLSTVSDDSTIIDSQSEVEVPLYIDLPLRSSSRVSFAPGVSYRGKNEASPISVIEAANAGAGFTKGNREMHRDGRIEAAKKFSSTLKDEPKSMKSEMLDSFIEDCLRSTNGKTRNENMNDFSPVKRNQRNAKLSGRDHPGTVETLKHMLLNLNGVAGGETDEEQYQKTSSDSARNMDDSIDDASSLPGEQSLTRAYHHLERLKSLINKRAELDSEP